MNVVWFDEKSISNIHNCFSFLQNGYCSFALRISSWARWTLYSLWRSHVLSHPFTSCQPEWSQVIHFFHLSVSLISWTIKNKQSTEYFLLAEMKNMFWFFVLLYCLCLQFGQNPIASILYVFFKKIALDFLQILTKQKIF